MSAAPDRFAEIPIGATAEVEHTVTRADLDNFARLTGDHNPLHVDDAFAQRTAFGRPVVHGMLTASFISTVIGMKLPGPGALWYEQSLRFLAAVRIGERIRVAARVIAKSNADRILVLETVVLGEEGRRLIEGEAKVKLLEVAVPELPAKRQAPGPIVVTGGAGGLGSAIARKLAANGHPVAIVYFRSAERARALAEEIANAGGRAAAIAGDLGKPGAASAIIEEAIATLGAVRGIVNNASPPMRLESIADLEWSAFQTQIDVQVRAAFELIQAALPHLGDGGSIVNVGSIAARGAPPPRNAPYILAKASLLFLTRAMAGEFGPRGIRVNSVSPGMIETAFTADMPAKAKMLTKAQTPLRRLGTPEDVAETVAFLISDAARHITGEDIAISGGV